MSPSPAAYCKPLRAELSLIPDILKSTNDSKATITTTALFMYTVLIINECKVLNFKCPFPSLEKPRLSYASGITDHWSFLQTLKSILTRRCVRQWMLIFVPYNKLVYGNSWLWCCATASARNYATPPPVLRAITGSASPLSLSAPAANLTPASSQVRRSTRYNAWSGRILFYRFIILMPAVNYLGLFLFLAVLLGILWCRTGGW